MALLVLTWLNQNNLVRKSFAIKLQRKKKKKIWHKTTTTPNLLSGAKRPKANNTTTKNDLYKKVITLTKTVHQLLMCQYNLARAIADMLSSSATGLLMSFCFDLYLSLQNHLEECFLFSFGIISHPAPRPWKDYLVSSFFSSHYTLA